MTKKELSLLLFFECRQVDNGGLVDTRHMNAEDMETAKKWNESGYIRFGRLHSSKLSKLSATGTHWCRMSEQAHSDAGKERADRAARVFRYADEIDRQDGKDVHEDV